MEGGVALAYRKEIAAADDPAAKQRELEDKVASAQSVFPRAEDFGVHEIIDPRRTRPLLAEWLEESQPQLRELVGVKSPGMRP